MPKDRAGGVAANVPRFSTAQGRLMWSVLETVMHIPRLQRMKTVPPYLRKEVKPVQGRKPPKPSTKIARVLKFLQDEGGCWTSAGIGEALGIDSHSVSKVINQLRENGQVRRVEWRDQPGHPAGVYEAIE